MIFAFTVSIDSFSVGITFTVLNSSIILSSLIFSITSFIFTYLGLKVGKKLSLSFGNITTFIGSMILIILGVSYLT